MSSGSKRAAPTARTGPSKKKSKKAYHLREIEIPKPAQASSSGTSSQQHTVVKDTRSYQVYELLDGRLGSRHMDGKVSVAVLPSTGTSSTAEASDEAVAADIESVLSHYPVDTPDPHQTSQSKATEGTQKAKRSRPELRAAVSPAQFAS